MLKPVLDRLVQKETLSEAEAFEVMDQIMKGNIQTDQLTSLLSLLRFRGETVQELLGFTKGMRQHMKTIQHDEEVIIDTCGTGGDGLSTFNISTAVAIVLASFQVKVAKHGNRKVSSSSGSADVLELLGVPVDTTPEHAAYMLKEKGMTFLYAPLYHQAMKHAVPARKSLGFRTVFNLLGPLSNPANSKHQMIGIFDTSLAEKLAQTLKYLGSKHVLLVTGENGLDEMSITGPTDMVELKNGEITRSRFLPEDVGIPTGTLSDIQVENSEQSAKLIQHIFRGEANSSATNIVVLNAAAGLYIAGEADSMQQGVEMVQQALNDGQVLHYYNELCQQEERVRHA
ncbi:anthranilate phosphoribosyltransferase [Pontibacillus yanchengensis]|uniref:Anthranilate phosphoribosyltransferase n=1 Tax=Pontibacillus yanchengensis TaxID=462910 RepID=A0A6I5A4E3_9BACI|nr:anthranilate phosphoribosyltransferase [Pontibacillus yanchengensis]MYL35201.1 anthranilate phosphoribosyltransferase [Pontibacillus yanchengensis]